MGQKYAELMYTSAKLDTQLIFGFDEWDVIAVQFIFKLASSYLNRQKGSFMLIVYRF